jgi:hypothetical protein
MPQKAKPNRKSQSALEYMMTYGWAILIIVIVAGVLYSLGIFTPSSSTGTTITGFNGFGSVQVECIGNQGAVIQLGDNLGYPIRLLNVSVSSASGSSSVYTQQTITPDSNTILYIPKVCPSQSSAYSLNVKISYVEPGQPLPGPYSSSGVASGTASSQQLSSSPSILTVIPMTISNDQNTSTANPFQQLVNVPSSVYSGYAASNFQNVEFFYANGTMIPSWLENYTSSNAIYWLKIGGLSAYSSENIYMGFAQVSTNLFNNLNDGEAPRMSSPYAAYDDGARVFNNYTNFAGTGLPQGWTKGAGANVLIDNGVYLNDSGWEGLTGRVFTGAFLIAFYLNTTGTTNMALGGYAHARFAGGCNSYTISGGNGEAACVGGTLNSLEYFVGWNNHYRRYGWNLENNLIYYATGPGDLTSSIDNLSLRSDSPATTAYIEMLAVISTDPNGIMPSVSFGQPSSMTLPANVQTYIPVTISNNQNTSVSIFQQMINPFSYVYSAYANLSGVHSFQNVEFFYANGTIIPSWLENYTSSNALWWLKLPSVPSYSSFTIYMGFASKTTDLFNNNKVGEAPQISPTYGEYDDGAKVFTNYWNFSGTSLPSGLVVSETGGTYSVNNGLTVTGGTNYEGIFSSSPINPQTTITDFYGYLTGTTYDSQFALYINTIEGTPQYFIWPLSANNYDLLAFDGTIGTGTLITSSGSQTTSSIWSMWASTSYAYASYDYGSTVSNNANFAASTAQYAGAMANSASNRAFVQWFRFRAYPPNGVMPSVSFGSVQ